jgi:surface antigen
VLLCPVAARIARDQLAAAEDQSLHSAGYSFDATPRVGDIAIWGTEVAHGLGHVAYVAIVTKGVATFDEYNVANTGAYTDYYTSADHPGVKIKPDSYIHLGTPKA